MSNMNHFQVILSKIPNKLSEEKTLSLHYDSSYSHLDLKKVFFYLQDETGVPFYYFTLKSGMKTYQYLDILSEKFGIKLFNLENTFFFNVSFNINGEKQIYDYYENIITHGSFHKKNIYILNKFMECLDEKCLLYKNLNGIKLNAIHNDD